MKKENVSKSTAIVDKAFLLASEIERAEMTWVRSIWERLVKSIKRPLKKVIGRFSLTYDQLQTLAVEIEGLLNAKPLTYIYDDGESISLPLTPSHLIYGRRVVNSPNGQYFEIMSTNKSLTRKFRHHRKLLQVYKKQWKREYLQSLRDNYNASGNQTPKITVGDVVIVQDEKTNRNFWKLAKVEELLPGDDGVVRAAVIKTCFNNAFRPQLLHRPGKHLIPLEVRLTPTADESNAESSEEDCHKFYRNQVDLDEMQQSLDSCKFVNYLDYCKYNLYINVEIVIWMKF